MSFLIMLLMFIGLMIAITTIKEDISKQRVRNAGLGDSKYAGFATLIGGNNPLLGSYSRKVLLAIKNNELIIKEINGEELLTCHIKHVKGELVSASAITAGKILIWGALSLAAKENLLQLEIYDEKSKETYKSIFKNAEFSSDWINKERYDYLVQENTSAPV